MKYDIFVSYRRSDRELVASVVRRLEARGVGVWYDAEIEGGADWREKIVEALTESEMLTIFFSEDSNNSRQLKKELAVADHLGKPVVPILIEDTQPRGAFLYELADRNWIQAFPDPMERIDELVDHLATLAGKDGLAGTVVANDVEKSKKMAPPAMGSGGFATPPAAPEPVREAEQPLAEAVEEFISGSDTDARPAPKIAKAYVGRVSQPGKPIRKLTDIPPFRWIDLAFLVPVWIAAGWWVIQMNVERDSINDIDRVTVAIALVCVVLTGLYGAVVFPVRYYLRRRPVLEALWKYLASTFVVFLIATGFFIKGIQDGSLPAEDFDDFLALFGGVWLGFALLAFLVYGVLSGQRAIRSFRSNIRKI